MSFLAGNEEWRASLALLNIDINPWVIQQELHNVKSSIKAGSVKGCSVVLGSCQTTLTAESLERYFTSSKSPLLQASQSCCSVEEDISLGKEERSFEKTVKTREVKEPRNGELK